MIMRPGSARADLNSSALWVGRVSLDLFFHLGVMVMVILGKNGELGWQKGVNVRLDVVDTDGVVVTDCCHL